MVHHLLRHDEKTHGVGQALQRFVAGHGARPILIVGTGRSGTHWLANILSGHPQVRATIEVYPIFRIVTRMAQDPAYEKRGFRKLLLLYRWQRAASRTPLYIDKSHPAMWIAERLKEALPDCLFIGIERNPYATASSMIKHNAVSSWHDAWKNYPVPNRFLGITEEMKDQYDSFSLARKCALRWRAHHERMQHLEGLLGDQVVVVDYDKLARQPQTQLSKIETFLDLNEPLLIPEIRYPSLTKWKENLAKRDVEEIAEVTGLQPPGEPAEQP